MKHELKIWPQYYCRVVDGTKTFEVRKNDRGFQPGDEVILKEYNPEIVEKYQDIGAFGEYYNAPAGYTGKYLSFKIGYVLPIDVDRVVFSLLPLTKPNETEEGV